MLSLEQLKAYLKIDFDDEDADLIDILIGSNILIETATGVECDKIKNCTNEKLKFLYIIVQKTVCKSLYDEQSTSGSILAGRYLKLTTMYRRAVKNGEIK